MRYYLENLPPSLQDQQEVLEKVIEALSQARPVHQVILFGSHVHGQSGPGSDVDLCILADWPRTRFRLPFSSAVSSGPWLAGRRCPCFLSRPDAGRRNKPPEIHSFKLSNRRGKSLPRAIERYFTDRYPGFDLEDPDWAELRRLMVQVESLAGTVRQSLSEPDAGD